MRPAARLTLWAVAALLLVALAVPKLLPDGSSGGPTAPSRSAAAALPVELHVVAPEPLAETLETTGTLFADERVEVVSEVAGKVVEIAFPEGARVAAGSLLVRIDDRELRAERERIAARLALAERREQRQRQLFVEQLISEQELETANTEADALRAELTLIETRLAKTEVRAPFSGVVGLRRVSTGAYISPQTRITTLIDLDPIKLEFAVPERYAGDLSPGDDVTFRVAGRSDEERTARVYAIEPSIDPETRTLPVRATSTNPEGRLLPGTFADVTLTVRSVPDALTVPTIAVIPELGGKRVYVADEGKAAPREVETGIRTGDRIEITRGLTAGDRVIVTGIQALRPGLAIESRPPAEADEAPSR